MPQDRNVDEQPRSATVCVQVRRGADISDHHVSLHDGGVTVAEVLGALGVGTGPVLIDDEWVQDPAGTMATDVLSPGSRINVSSRPSRPHRPAARIHQDGPVEISVVGGIDAGRLSRLHPGVHLTAGCFVNVEPGRLGHGEQPWHEHGGTVEAFEVGSAVFGLSRSVDSEAGLGRFVHRPPRVLPAESVEPIVLTDAPKPVAAPSRLSWATLLAPLPIALVMAMFFRPLFAIFAAMGPVVALGRWYESRRRFRRETRRRVAEVAQIRAGVQEAVGSQVEAEARLRWLSQPSVAELWRRARTRSVRLWERRPGDVGFLVAAVGIGPARFQPHAVGVEPQPEVHGEAEAAAELRSVPHVIDMAANMGIGLYGRRLHTLAVARAIVLQLATLHGPADLSCGVVCRPGAAARWDWIKWLPHADPRLTSSRASDIARGLGRTTKSAPLPTARLGSPHQQGEGASSVSLIVVDDTTADVSLLQRSARDAGHELRILALADLPTRLPAVCSTLVGLDRDDRGVVVAQIVAPASIADRCLARPIGVSAGTAAAWARSLAGAEDPESGRRVGQGAPSVGLLHLLSARSGAELRLRWRERSQSAGAKAALGVGDDGVFSVDLADDGPHVLIAGTTGAGKSELLRTLVVSLAYECPPEHLNFVLVDFKGGGAFDACAPLPHVAGLITDLDEALVSRAITSLRAELLRREVLFRDVGVSGFNDAVRVVREPLARLLVVIDEFAALATDHPELMASIVDLAARGRSLGMHLILATQRPSGVVDQKIRANTNLRIALRVQDAFDSQDVIGAPDAAMIDRRSPGRAVFSVGGDTPTMVQTAYGGGPFVEASRCTVRPFLLFEQGDDQGHGTDQTESAELREIDVVVEMIKSANAPRAHTARPLWVEPLPETLDWIDLGTRVLSQAGDGGAGVALGLADIPEQQVQLPWRWEVDSGALVVYGSSAQCAGKALVSVGAGLAAAEGPDQLHLYVIDGGAGEVAPLGQLPHTGALIAVDERERVERLLARFERELAARRVSTGDAGPRMVMMIDNIAALLACRDDLAALAVIERLSALARDGTSRRLHLVLSSRAVRDLSHRLAQQIPNRLVLELADPNGYLTLGLNSRDVAPLPRMRAIDPSTRRVIQLVEPPELRRGEQPCSTEVAGLPEPIRTLRSVVDCRRLPAARVDAEEALVIPVGSRAEDLADATWTIGPGAHAVVIATAGMGRSATLAMLLEQIARGRIGVELARLGPARSPLTQGHLPGRALRTVEEIESLRRLESNAVLVVDDAHRLDDEIATALETLIDAPNLRIIAGTTSEHARSARSWLARLRSHGIGIFVGATVADGDLLKVRLQNFDGFGRLPGRGYVVSRGTAEPVQLAIADPKRMQGPQTSDYYVR